LNAMVLVYLVGSTVVFMAANATLKTYAASGGVAVLVAALALFCVGNFLMVRVMKENGLGLAIALSLIFQLIAITLMAVVWFGERPSTLQIAGLVLGVIAVTMIVWPQGGAS
jgi:small multidrug resistance pump